jgi:uncharacterized protein
MSDAEQKPSIDPVLLAIMCCPLTRSPMRQEGTELVAEKGGLRYPIREGIPILLAEEARLPVGVESLEEFKRRFVGLIPD